jgi:DNA-binding transcriptional MerR regulator
VVAPERADTNRRLYSEADIKRLQLLKKAVDRGHSISLVARMSADELIRLINRGKNSGAISDALNPATRGSPEASYFCDLSVARIINLDAAGLEAALSEAAVHLTRPELIKGLIVPLYKEMAIYGKRGT